MVKADTGRKKNKPVQPPREILGDFCKKNAGFTKEDVQRFARECLLSEQDVEMWLRNIQTIKRNSKKKQKKKQKNVEGKICIYYINI